MPKKPDQLETIDLDALANVSGGRSSAAAPSSGGGGGGGGQNSRTDPNGQLMSLLTEITSELQGMTQNHNQQDPFMRAVMLMRAMQGGGNPFGGMFQQFDATKKV